MRAQTASVSPCRNSCDSSRPACIAGSSCGAASVTGAAGAAAWEWRSEEHTSELQSLMRISYAVFCLKKKTIAINQAKDRTNGKHDRTTEYATPQNEEVRRHT